MAVKILLPPSEGKTTPEFPAATLNLDSLIFEELRPARELLLDALAQISASPDAMTRLKVGASLSQAVAANVSLRQAPAAPAHQIYTGVLYQGLDYASLTSAQATWAQENILVSSALFGMARISDVIPAYRLSMDTNMGSYNGQRIGGLATFWRKHLNEPFAQLTAGHVIVDARSTSYVKATNTDPQLTAAVDVFTSSQGQLKKVSHFAKHYRGVLAALLARAAAGGQIPTNVEELRELTVELLPEYTVKLFPSTNTKSPATLALIIDG